ncbi:uncharacterized protein Z518_01652 [Rhinocladiella mackenziei CBS 650.93]|uniref:prephenate dehydratase n=1 Tax=Rhinocladiella mackenziei CBS 650.93 TaxID=1442369 RepID=A0A0D2HIU4_9EURO|nr:uncharacterized protein Z518_01652 [Rhinocladiella mackenziei CBS 650.93]KIX10568.1 hypothetical protein Z518_01652 [Rhinocladiella mackenziei CBS 650.93]
MFDRGESASPLNIAYLGPEASFSHQAAVEVFAPSSSSPPSRPASLHPLPSFTAIFSSIQNSSSTCSSSSENISYDYAVIPIENSTNGSVFQILDLLAQCGLDSSALYPDVEVCAEYYLPVHHCLFVSSPPNSRDSKDPKQSIRTLYTHPQVWGQCGRFLSTHFPPNLVERIDVGSTSAAAQLVAQESNGGFSAAIGSQLAGQKNNLVCLAENIEDEPGSNTTRFFVVRNRKRPLDQTGYTSIERSSEHIKPLRYKSLITFTIPHAKPGSLADALAVFKQHSFNLTSIDTRPSRQRNWQYVFFVECENIKAEATQDARVEWLSDNLRTLLDDLSKFTESLRCLGTFQDQLPRENGTGAEIAADGCAELNRI